MNRVDLVSGLSFVAGGGLAAAAVGVSTLAPHYQTQILAVSAIVIGVAGLLTRVFGNPTPTNTIQVFDRNTGSTVEMKTVATPSKEPAAAPTYAKETT